jgi:hypothetical protein
MGLVSDLWEDFKEFLKKHWKRVVLVLFIWQATTVWLFVTEPRWPGIISGGILLLFWSAAAAHYQHAQDLWPTVFSTLLAFFNVAGVIRAGVLEAGGRDIFQKPEDAP